MTSLTGNLIALMVDDDGYAHGYFPELMSCADITITVVPNSDEAFREFDRISVSKDPLDVFITDHSHPGLPGPELIKKIRGFPDEKTSLGGLRLRHVPMVVYSAFQDPSQIAAIDSTIRCVQKPGTIEELLKAIDDVVRDHRDRVLSDFHHVGIGIRFVGGRLSLVHCYAFPADRTFETKYIDASWSGGPRSAARAYHRLVLIADRHWSAHNAVQEFEALLDRPKTKERDIQSFFQLHPEFLYQNCVADHWSEPHLQDAHTGHLYKPDFVLKSVFLPDRPWSWQVVDLKRPQVPVLTNAHFHATLSQHIHKVVSQLRNYSEYFDRPENQDSVRRMFGGEIRKPKLVAIIGRLPKDGVLNEYARLRSQVLDVSIMTYDEILEFRRSQVDWR